jgi:hypothetical protein
MKKLLIPFLSVFILLDSCKKDKAVVNTDDDRLLSAKPQIRPEILTKQILTTMPVVVSASFILLSMERNLMDQLQQ